jgi:predicted transcriptional regulator YheO
MNKLKSIFIKTAAACMLIALVSLNVNIDSFPNISWDTISISMETQTANAQADPSELKLFEYICSSGETRLKCKFGGNGCDISRQTVCPNPNPEVD